MKKLTKPVRIISLCLLAIIIAASALIGVTGKNEPYAMRNVKLAFKDPSFSFQFLRTMSYTGYQGAELGECYAAAAQIKDGDIESWYSGWSKTADRVKNMADEYLENGNIISARDAYLRASNYYRTAEFYLHKNPNDERAYDSWNKSRKSFMEAGKLFTPSFEAVKIPYENTTLPGYLFKVDDSGKPRPTIIAMTGYDGTAEEMYFQIAAAALERGYNVLSFDGPGQGGAIRDSKLYLRPDWENVVTPVVDFLIERSEVDSDRIALAGYSMGGYFAPRAAAFEHRIAACVADSGVYSFFDGSLKDMAQNQSFLKELSKENSTPINLINQVKMKFSTEFSWKMYDGMWKFNVTTPHQVLKKYQEYTLNGVVEQIKCPVLVCDTEDEEAFGDQGKILFDKLKCPKERVMFTREEGSDAHCQYGANRISNTRILDWLDKTLNNEYEELTL